MGRFVVRLPADFLEFDGQISIVRRHFPVVPPGNGIGSVVGAVIEHASSFNKILSAGHLGHLIGSAFAHEI